MSSEIGNTYSHSKATDMPTGARALITGWNYGRGTTASDMAAHSGMQGQATLVAFALARRLDCFDKTWAVAHREGQSSTPTVLAG